jgi:hypothetical protein
MGAWGVRCFENDSALDCIYEFQERPTLKYLEAIFKTVLSDEEYLEIDEASSVLAAAEIIAALKGQKSTDFPEELEAVIEDISIVSIVSIDSIKSLAVKAIQKVKNDSELRDLWEESNEFDKWLQVVENLVERIQ